MQVLYTEARNCDELRAWRTDGMFQGLQGFGVDETKRVRLAERRGIEKVDGQR